MDNTTTRRPAAPAASAGTALTVTAPGITDGAAMWRLARDSRQLDLNSSYAYLLWCHDFADTSAVASTAGEVVGFVTGYLRPRAPDTLVIWQVAVASGQRARGVASLLLDHVLRRVGPAYLETTITPDNGASVALFTGLASRWGAALTRSPFLAAARFPEAHAAEDLYRIGPFAPPQPPPRGGLPRGSSTGEL